MYTDNYTTIQITFAKFQRSHRPQQKEPHDQRQRLVASSALSDEKATPTSVGGAAVAFAATIAAESCDGACAGAVVSAGPEADAALSSAGASAEAETLGAADADGTGAGISSTAVSSATWSYSCDESCRLTEAGDLGLLQSCINDRTTEEENNVRRSGALGSSF